MKQLYLTIMMLLAVLQVSANNVEIIYQGPKDIGDWGTVELSSIKFHSLELGDTVYVFAKTKAADAKGAFQNHRWNDLAPGVLNGQTITGDFELIVDSRELLGELKKHGLKVRGSGYVLQRVAIKHTDNRVRTIILIAAAIIVFIVLVAFAILLWKNRQLGRAYHNIYKANLDVLEAYDRDRRLRLYYEGQIQAFKEAMQATKVKYQGSTLDSGDTIALANQILRLMEDTDEIYAPDFTLQKLADLVGSNYKNVSQAINEQLGKNFNQMVNEYRIQEACRRMNDRARYGNYTIEAIGESVGFGSRSTFVSTFKKVTGLTPSEFQRQAKAQ